MKTVFSKTQDVCDLWAAQSQPEARTSSNTRFRDQTLYSYGTPIARIVKGKGNAPYALIHLGGFGTTTATVIGQARRAAEQRCFGIFDVPKLDVTAEAVSSNLKHFEQRIAGLLESLRKGRPTSEASYRSAAKAVIALAEHYGRTFGKKWTWKGENPDTVICRAAVK